MGADDRKGQAPTAEELFDHCLTLADICVKSQEEAHALRDEVRRALDDIGENHNEAMRRVAVLVGNVGKQGEEMRGMYAPDAVKGAAINAQKAVGEFERKTGGIFESIQQKADGVVQAFWMRTLGAVAVGIAAMLMVFGVLWWVVPSVDEMKARRAELQDLNAGIDKLSGKVLNYDGGKWVRADGPPQSLCQTGTKNCANYVRVR